MARTLLESIQKKLETPEQAKASSAEQGAGSLLRSKLTGKAGSVAAPSTTSEATQAATATTQAGLDTLAQQDQVSSSAIQGRTDVQQQQQEQALQSADLDKTAIEQRFDAEQENLLREMSRSDRRLDTDRDLANLEQLGFMAAMTNREYMQKLEEEGRQRRFDDDLTFREELQNQVFSDSQDLFRGDLDFKKLLNMDRREFAEKMGSLNIDHALEIAEHQADAASTRAIYSGVMGTVTGGLKAYDAYSSSSSPSPESSSNLQDTETGDPVV